MSVRAPTLPAPLRRFVSSPYGAAALVLAVTALVYVPSFQGDWQLDDRAAILDNAGLAAFDAAAILRFGWPRALTQLSFALNAALSGPAIVTFHLLNLAIHLANAALVFVLGRRLYRMRGGVGLAPPVFAALIFALHPLQTEAVVYIVQRSESLCFFFVLAALELQLRDREAGQARPSLAGYGALACAVAAMLSKEPGFMAPLLIVFAELWLVPSGPHAPLSRRQRLLRLTPWLALLVLCLGAFLIARGALVFSATRQGVGPWAYLMSQQEALARLAGLALWPRSQSIDHAVAARTLASAAPWFLNLAAGAAFITIKRREAPLLFWALVSSLLILGPSSSLVPLEDALVEHRAYGPLAFFALALVLEGARRCRPRHRKRAGLALSAALVILAVLSQARQRMWASELALWEEASRVGGDEGRPWVRLGLIIAEQGIWGIEDEGRRVYARRAAAGGFEPCEELGGGPVISEDRAGDALSPRALSLDCYRRAVAVDPGSREGRVNLAAGLARLGLELGEGDPEEAAAFLEEAEGLLRGVIADEPESFAARYNLGLIAARDSKRGAEAEGLLREAAALAAARGQEIPGLRAALGKLLERRSQRGAAEGREQ